MDERLRKKAEETFGLDLGDEIELELGWRAVRRKVIPVVIPLLKDFFTDETAFIRMFRAIVLGLGLALHDGEIPYFNGAKAWWIGPFVAMLSVMLGAGDKNKSPEEIKAIASDPTITPKG